MTRLHRIIWPTLSALLAALAGCAPPASPVGKRTANIDELEQAGWHTIDTLVTIDPQTFEESLYVNPVDRSPDTLPGGQVVFHIAEYMPVFAGCETAEEPALCTQRQLNNYVSNNLQYPRAARVRGIEGSTIATFVVGADGRVTDTGIERSMGDQLDKAVLDLIGELPVWHPGFHHGEPVAVRYRLPVTFDLPPDE